MKNLFSIMWNLQTHYHLKIDFQKVYTKIIVSYFHYIQLKKSMSFSNTFS